MSDRLPPLVMKPIEVARYLQLSRSKTYELIARGVIPSVSIEGSLRVPLADLMRYVDGLPRRGGAS